MSWDIHYRFAAQIASCFEAPLLCTRKFWSCYRGVISQQLGVHHWESRVQFRACMENQNQRVQPGIEASAHAEAEVSLWFESCRRQEATSGLPRICALTSYWVLDAVTIIQPCDTAISEVEKIVQHLLACSQKKGGSSSASWSQVNIWGKASHCTYTLSVVPALGYSHKQDPD